MRIAQLMAGAPAGGAELFFERLSIALHDAGETVLPVIRRDDDRAARLTAAGLSPAQLRFGGPLDLLTAPKLARRLRSFHPHVAIAWMNRAARFAPTGAWVLAGRLGGYYDLSYYRRCTDLIANTRALARWIAAQGWPAGRVHYLPNFVPDLAGAPAARLPIPSGRRAILAAGRLHTNKGFDILIRALPDLVGTDLVLAGDGPARASLEALARAEGVRDRVAFLGWRHDMAGLLAAASVFVCPSRHEPLGNVVLEAFSAGCPVVAAAADGPRELIEDGRNGLLVAPEDPASLAAAIARVLGTPALGLAAAARRDYEQTYATAPVLAAWRDGLARIVAGNA